MNVDAYCRWLSRHFYVRGCDRDDVVQEALLAAWLSPNYPRLAARRQVMDMMKVANRRAFDSTEYADIPCRTSDVVDVVAAREHLREVLSSVRTEAEREALGRTIRGEPVDVGADGKRLSVALSRFRRRLTVPAPTHERGEVNT